MVKLHLSQQDIFFDQILDSKSSHYNIGTYVVIKGNLNVELFKKAIISAADVFDIFKFEKFPEDIPGVYLKNKLPKIDVAELHLSNAAWTEEQVAQSLRGRINVPFDIHSGDLYDFALIKRQEQEHWFYVGCHHLFSDGYGVPYVLLSYIFDKYHSLRTGDNKEFNFPSYLSLAEKSGDYLASKNYELDRSFWKERFKESGGSVLQKKTKTASFQTDSVQLNFNLKEQQRLREFCRENEISLQDLLIAVLTVYYKKTSDIKFFDFCLPIHNRNDRKERQTFGVFSKFIPCRIEADNPVLSELLKSIKLNQRQDYRHKQFPVSHFNSMMQADVNNSSRPFDICVNYRYFKLNTSETELMLKGFRNDSGFSKTPVEYSWCDFSENGNDNLFLEITFREDYFDKAEIEMLSERLLFIIEQFYNYVGKEIDSFGILPEKEKQTLLTAFNNTDVVYPKNKTVIDLFWEQVLKTPDKVAILFEENALTYRELDERSNQLAHYLQKNYNIKPDNLVGIRQQRSEWTVISVLGVLKSGAAYVPIDPAYPQERIDYIEKDTKCKVCLDEKELSSFIKDQAAYSKTRPVAVFKPENLSHVIYTSGSTGRPKGVLIEHRNTYSFIKWSHDEFANSDFDTVLFTTSLNFDLSVFEIFYTLTNGKALTVLKDGLSISQHLEKGKKLLVNTVPSVVGSLLQQGISVESIAVLNMAGEPIPSSYKEALKGKVKEIRNLYGPSEDTTYSTVFRIDKDQRDLIGKPISNTQVYILNGEELQAIGAIGEICIGGEGLARGYLNQEALTKEKFVPHPFEAGARIYRTGDLGRWLPDGNIEFLGRKDDQVKIRGYRIELGEIEHALLNNKEIEQAVVIAKENKNNEKELVAYITCKKEQKISDLRAGLKRTLPEYMLPAYYVQLKELPLNSNGKVDKKNLPHPEDMELAGGTEYVAPRNELEEKLVKIWEEVLQRQPISVKDDFFSLGGHSLKAVRLSNEYQKQLSAKLSLKDLFTNTSIEQHAEIIGTSKREDYIQIEKVAQHSHYPISDAQRRLWVLSQFEGGSVAYNMPGSIELTGAHELVLFQKAFDSLIQRHEILRTVFKEDETGEIRQWILKQEHLGFAIDYKDFSEEENKEEKVKDYIAQDSYKPFDLEKGPLLRACLLKTGDERYIFYFNMHHIISDGWSIRILSKEVFAYYEACKDNKKPELPELRIQYKDYSAWVEKQLEEESFKDHRAYWLENLSGELPLLNLPGTKQRPKITTNNGYALSTYINSETKRKLTAYLQKNEGSLLMALLAAWNVLMYRYTSQTDIITGIPVAGRNHADLEDQIGLYVNTLALRNEINPGESFDELFSRIKQNSLNAYVHQMYPFDRLVEELKLQRDTGRNAVFDMMLTFESEDEKIEDLDVSGLKEEDLAQVKDLGRNVSKFDIDITFKEIGQYLSLHIAYNSDIYERQMIEELINHYKQLLHALLENPEEKLSQVDYLSKEEKHELLFTLNDTSVAYPKDKTIVDLFEEQVVKKPGGIAVVFEDTEISYLELDELSNQLAHYLHQNYKIRPDDLIGIKLERSEWMIIAILGALKSGGAYVPIDPEYPQDRIDYIEEDTKCKVCIDENELARFKESRETYSRNKLSSLTKADNLAYVIYTSGTTGQSKGVMVTNSSVTNIQRGWVDKYELNNIQISLLQLASMSFDVFMGDLCRSILAGGKAVLCPSHLKLNPGDLYDFISKHSISIIEAPPTILLPLMDYVALNDKPIDFLKVLIFGSDTLSIISYTQIRKKFNTIKIINSYGTTETTIDSSYYEDSNVKETVNNITPIGKPFPNISFLVLDSKNQLLPKGIIGEICIGGAGLARGYLNKEALTKEKFITHPFKEGERLYKTGDLGRWLPDGNMEFLGRKDDQVKIRGYRIELGEIEHALQSHKAIEEAVVLAKENQNKEKELVAYITAKQKQNTNELRTYLKKLLPDYMLPVYYVQLETFPLTSNGKINRKSLPEPQGLGLTSGIEFIAPRNGTEAKLVKIWETILQRENIGVKDDFFALGGHSLKAVRLINEYQKSLAIKLSLKDLFTHTSIESHAELIDPSKKHNFIQIEKTIQKECYQISDAQRRLWVLSQFEGGSVAYNMPGCIQVEGVYELVLFQKAFDSLIQRHEILRTVFKEDETGEIKQWILKNEDSGFKIDYKDFRKEENKEEKIKEYITGDSYKPFDLEKGPLLRAGLLQVDSDRYVFYFNMHHIISDGWSMEILSRDVLSYYEAYKNDKEPALKELRIQYRDYSAWALARVNEASFKAHRSYWLENLSGELPLLNLPARQQRPKIKTYNGQTLGARLNKELSQKLKDYSHQHGGTLFMYLLASLKVLLYRYTGQDDLIIGTPVAGREHADLEDQIGFYVNTLALRNKIDPEESFNELFSRIRQNTLNAYDRQMYPFDRLVEELNLKKDTSRSAVFDVMLVLQNTSENAAGLELKDSPEDQVTDIDSKTSKFDLLIDVQEEGGYLSFSVQYNTDVYEREMIENFIVNYKTLLSKLVAEPTQALGKIDYLPEEEKQKLLVTFNNTKVDYSAKTVMELFEAQVVKSPDKTALVFEEKLLTYKELNEQSNALAHILKEQYRASGKMKVGVMLERSLESVIAMLGVMKAGACYVPIDHDYPAERVAYLLKDSAVEVIISEEELCNKHGVKTNSLVNLKKIDLENGKKSNPETTNHLDDGAYVIYTSGSTGKPKGVVQTHRMMSNLIQWDVHHSGIERHLKHLQYASFSFDVSLQDCWSALSAGGTMHIANDKIRIDFSLLWKYIVNNGIQVVSFPFSAFQQFVIQNASQDFKDLQVKHIACSGEQLMVNSLLRKFLDNNPKLVLHNHYGPSETHVVTSYKMSPQLANIESRASIGQPISNSRIYILDQYQNLVPQGVAGELYIGGENLAAGYLNLEKETKEKFIDNPFTAGKLYKTGDQGYWRSDGNIDFTGRKDDQLKIRGYRIELGEIEHALQNHKDIEEAVVLARENQDNEKELVAYITSKVSQNTSELRAYLKETLPVYMLPVYYVQLDVLPLTGNGKVDKKSLPAPYGIELKSGIEYVAPRNTIENKLIEMLSDLLGKSKHQIGINDNFFDLGINSMKLIRLLYLVNKEFDKNLKAVVLFEYSTVNDLSLHITNESGNNATAEVINEEDISKAMDEMIDLM